MEMPSRAEVEERIRERAASDPGFRAQLMADPRSALESELGVAIPEEITVRVHQEYLSEVHVVLPPATEDLSDADLELISGGICWSEPSAGINIP